MKASHEAHRRVVADLKANAEVLRGVGCRIKDAYGGITLLVGTGVVLTVQYECFHANSLEGAALTAGFYDGVPPIPNHYGWEEPQTLKKWKFTFELVGPSRSGWIGPDRKEHAPEALAEFLLKHFLELQQQRLP